MSGSVHDDSVSAIFADRTAELCDISRFLHDTISQDLVALSFTLSQLQTMALNASARTEVESALRMLDRCCREVRLIGSMLAPPSISDITLDAAIAQLAQFLRDETDIPVTLDLDPVPPLQEESQLLLIASVQMWFARAIRHRAGRSICARLRGRPKKVFLGLEMSPPPAGALAGWTVLRERARAHGGDFSIESNSGRMIASVSLPEGSGA